MSSRRAVSNSDRGRLIVTGHARTRFRERWPNGASCTDRYICSFIRKQVKDAMKRGDIVNTPDGALYPISFLGKDGYVLIMDSRVVTVMSEDWCPEANEVRSSNG